MLLDQLPRLRQPCLAFGLVLALAIELLVACRLGLLRLARGELLLGWL